MPLTVRHQSIVVVDSAAVAMPSLRLSPALSLSVLTAVRAFSVLTLCGSSDC